ncbi:hypothetical protein B0J15DRAFT_563251 [Fusarium solani]|uniref:Uncharacterized protein n=1 Tax=Fusarium solani TaxID=169388 RepID=A0A9P9GZC2_FUSSL|nr:uncharacterized protein B0J15DRAFT_563251 [Fusarium solani]KAH7247851.1 hypothetical protein B0J15DRAFT_563251 [Fusarium solani]
MGFFLLSLLVAAVGQTSTVASQPLELAPRADDLCSAGEVEFTDTVRDMFTGFTSNYCRLHKPGEEETWSTGNFWVTISSSADGCAAPASMPENECKDSFKKSIDACSVGSKISGGNSLWTGPDGTCLKFSMHAEPLEVEALKTDIEFHAELNEVDVGEGLYSCDDYMKLFDSAKEACLSIGCDVNKKACDDQTCVTIDGTTNQGVDDKFKGYLDQLRGVIAGSCKTEAYEDYYCTPNGVCSTNKRVKVQIPSFLGSSTAKDEDTFVANYKVTFTQKETKSSCDIVTALRWAGKSCLIARVEGSFNAPLRIAAVESNMKAAAAFYR